MANTLQVRRGAKSSLPTLNAGEFGLCTDTYEVFIGDGAANHQILTYETFNATSFLYATSDNTPENKTPAEVMVILSGDAGASFSMNSQKITSVLDPGDDQDVATKKYVDDNTTGLFTVTYNNSDTTINLTTADLNEVLLVDNASAVAINLPSVASGDIGKWAKIHKMGAGDITINRADSDTLEDGTSVSNIVSSETWSNISLFLATATKWKFNGTPLGTWVTS